VVDHTYRFNRPYGRTIAPIGQTYDGVPASEIVRFRQVAAAEGATGLSWWSWQHTTAAGWNAVGQEIDPFTSAPAPEFATLAKGKKGDLVRWAQQHLKGAGQTLTADGDFGAGTVTAVKNFQTGAGLPPTGEIDTATWQALLEHAPAKVSRAPKTAKLPARRYEIGPRSGSGWHATG
jgi:murein L,D-transpeptidase YcbB/YkuD